MDISNVIKDLFTALDNFVKATGLRYDYENNDYKTDVELDADMEMLASIENAHSDLSYYLGISSQSSNENEEISDIRYVIDNADADKTAVYMTEILTDPNISTYKMLEGLASKYLSGNAEFKKGIDTACMALTGESMTDIAKKHKKYT